MSCSARGRLGPSPLEPNKEEAMFYALMGYMHAHFTRRVNEIRRLAGEAGQGTVEYVGLILLVSLLMVGTPANRNGHSFTGER
jgi:hypothetical protein